MKTVLVRGIAALFVSAFFTTIGQVTFAQADVAKPIATSVGAQIQLDPTDGFSATGTDALRAEWTWITRPDASVADFSDAAVLRPYVTIDIPGTYEAELNLYPADSGATEAVASTTLLISTDSVAPVAQTIARGAPDSSSPLTLDGTRSYDVDGEKLTYAWSLLSGPDGNTASFDATDVPIVSFSYDNAGTYVVELQVQDSAGLSSTTTFDIDVDGGAVDDQLSTTLETFNLVTNTFFGRQEVEGRTFIGSSVDGTTGQFGFRPAQDGADFAEMYVDGDLVNSTINLTPGDEARISGSAINSTVNNGVLIEGAGDLPAFDFQSFKAQSAFLASLTGEPADLADQNNKKFGGIPNAVAAEAQFGANTRIVTATMQDLQSGGYSIDLSQADTVIINVSGTSGSFQMNPLGGTGFAENVLWNFYEATNINVNSVIVGHVLAPHARMSGFSGSSEGTVIADDVQLTNGELHQRAWLGQVPQAVQQEGGSRNVAPTASFGFDQIATVAGETVRLDPYMSTDIDGDQLAATARVVSGPDGAEPVFSIEDGFATFVADVPGDYLVGYEVTDGSRLSFDHLLISVGAENVRPVAKISAVPDATLDQAVLLDGTQSFDFDGDLLTYTWNVLARPQGSAAEVSEASTPLAGFVPDVEGLYVVQLAVSDGQAASTPTTLAINVGGQSPVANAGLDLAPDASGRAQLDGTLSVGDGLAFQWSVLSLAGEAATLDDASLAMPFLTLPPQSSTLSDLVASTVVYENRRPGQTGSCVFSTTPPANIADPAQAWWHGIAFWASGQVGSDSGARPVWIIDNQREHTRDLVLEATDGTQLGNIAVPGLTRAYFTTEPLSSGAQLRLFLNGNQIRQADPATWTFSQNDAVCADASGLQVAQLIVSDGNGFSVPDTVVVSDGNLRPVLRRVAQVSGLTGIPLSLSANSAGFDANADALSYVWSIIYRPAGSTTALSDVPDVRKVAGDTIEVTPDRPGTYLVQLEASDGALFAEPAVFVIEVEGSAPVAVATGPGTAFVNDLVTLDGSGSFDADGDALSYAWTVRVAPDGSSAVLSDAAAVMPTFTPDAKGSYVFDLVVSDAVFTSSVASIALDVPNRAPVAVFTGPAQVGFGAEVILSTAGSSDPDGDLLSFAYDVVTAPAGANPMLMPLADGTVGFRSETAGEYLVQVAVSDGIDTATQTLTLVVLSGNQAPILGPLNDLYTVELGLELVLDLTGQDPDDDPLTFFADPLPLPAGVTLDATTGAIRFRPEVGQEGEYTFTVGVSDGSLTDRDTLNISVVPGDAGDTAITGRVLDAVDFANGIETPLGGIPVRLRDAAVMAITEADGTFSIGSLTAGSEQIFVEPSADGGPGGYSSETRVITVTDNQIRDLNPDFLLTPLGDGCAPVVPGVETLLASAVSGVTVTIGADTIQDGSGAAYEGEICLGSLPRLFQQPGLPDQTNACQIYALDAPGAVFTAGITISGPNVDELPETTQLELWRLSNSNGLFRPAANAIVDAGGATVSSTATGFNGPALFTFLPQSPVAIASADMSDGNNRELTPFEGNLAETYTLPGYRAFNRMQQISLAYNSAAADPTIIVSGDVTIADNASLPETVQTRIDLSGLAIDDSGNWTPRLGVDGSEPALVGETVTLRQSMPFDATGLSQGRYDYTYYSSASYACSTVSGVYRGELYVQNRTDSPYGQGWSIDELQTLVQRPDGKVAIIDDDSVDVFDPEPTFTEFDEEARLVFPAVGPQGISTADLDGDGDLDVVFGNSGDGTVRTLTNLGGREIIEAAVIPVEDGNEVPPTGIYFPNIQGALPIDLNGDELADIAYTAQGSDTLAFLENEGLGSFEKQVAITNFGQLTSIAVDDIDGDGFEDAVFSRFAGFFGFGNTEIYVDYGGEGGRFRQRVARQSFGDSGLQIETGDINGDGLRDIIYRIDDGIQIIINRGGRDYDLFDDDLGGAGTDLLGKYFDVADLNNDGLDDIVATHTTGGVQVFLRDPVGFFFPPVVIPYPAGAGGLVNSFLLDVQGDGEVDLLLSYGTASGAEVSVYRGNGDGTFQPPEAGLLEYIIAEQQAADVDGDGSLDLISLQRFSVTVDFSKPSADGNLVAGKGEFSTLVQLPDGGWERRYKDGNTVIFNAEGLQTAEVDTQGNRREFGYGDNGELTSVTDQVGGVTLMAYDDRGRLTTVTYPDGRVTEMEYQDVQLVGVTEPDGDQVEFAYDEFGRLNSTINQNGNETVYSHDDTGKMNGATLPDGSSIRNQVASSLGLVDDFGGAVGNPRPYVAPEDRVTTVTDRKGEVSEVIVNSFGSTVQVTDPIGRVTRMERDFNDLVERLERPSDGTASGVRVDLLSYDGRANVTQMVEAFGTPEQRTMAYVYEPEFNKVTSMTDGDGFVTNYAYDNFGEVTEITDPEGGVQRRSYTSRGKLFSRTDERGNVTRFNYLTNQNLGTITYADGSVTEMLYDPQGNASEVTESAGTETARTIVRTFDSDNRVTSVDVIDAAVSGVTLAALSTAPVIDGVTTYAYDGVGNLTQTVDETGLTTTMTYDALERLVQLDDPAEGMITRTYNEAGEVTEHVNGDGASHTYMYDAVSRLTQTTDAEGFVKTFDYDARDNIRRVVDGRGGETVFTFDGLDRMVTRSNPLNQVMRREYDRRDNLTSLTREDGAVETATYDGKSRRTEVVTPDNTLRYGYDPRDNVILAEDDDSRVTMTYDERNRLTTTTTDGSVGVQPSVTLTYTYDQLDRRTSMTDSLGGVYGYGYDEEDRLTSLATPWGVEYGMSYDDFGRRTALTSTTGRASAMAYTNGLLTALSHAQNGVTLTDLVYRYDVDGQLIGIDDQLDPSQSKGISYDDLNRLVQVAEGVPVAEGGTQIPVEDYAYDQEGNRLASHLSALYTSDAHNRLLEDDDFTYGYDEKGNRISKTAKADGATELYVYDSQNRLISYTDRAGATTEYHYDAMERRIAKVQGRNATAYIYDMSVEDPLAHDDITLEFAVVGPEDTGGGGGGGSTDTAACNAALAAQGAINRDLFNDGPLPGVSDELLAQFGGPLALLTFEILIAAGGDPDSIREQFDLILGAGTPPECEALLDDGGTGGGGGGNPDYASCNAQLQLAGVVIRDLFASDFPLPGLTNELIDSYGGPDAPLTFDLLIDAGGEGFLLEETLSFVFQGEIPLACLELLNGGPGGPGDGPDPAQVAECNVELSRAGVLKSDLLRQDAPLNPALITRLEGPEGDEPLTIGFLQDEGVPLFIVPGFFEVSPPACFGLDDPFILDGPEGLNPETSGIETQSSVVASVAAEFTSAEAESVTLVRRWAHTNMVDEPIGFEAYADDATPGSGSVYEMYADRQGSILTVFSNSDGALAERYEYEGYGTPTATISSVDQPYQYISRQYDGESGLYYYRTRYFDPQIGLFIQSDPLQFDGDSLNLYGMSQQNPFGRNDPDGMKSVGYVALTAATLVSRPEYQVFAGISMLAVMISQQLSQLDGKLFPEITNADIPASANNRWPNDDDRCLRARARKERAQTVVNALGACHPAMGLGGRALRHVAWRELGFARSERDIACHGGSDAGHMTQIREAFKQAGNCAFGLLGP